MIIKNSKLRLITDRLLLEPLIENDALFIQELTYDQLIKHTKYDNS